MITDHLSHLSAEMIYELGQLDEQDRKFVLKQAVSGIFDDIMILFQQIGGSSS
jgi:hypothetical protein